MTAAWRDAVNRAELWFNERPIRERALLLVTTLVVLLFLGWELVLGPMQQASQQQRRQLAVLDTARQDLLAQQMLLEQQLAEDPSQVLRNQLQVRERRLAQLDQQIAATTGQLIAPTAMVTLLRDMLRAQKGLTLQALELKAPTPVFAQPADEPGAPDDSSGTAPEALLYAHNVELRVQGGYLDVLAYLKQVEAMDNRLGWIRLTYDAENWPKGEATIEVQTLSLDKAWLGV